jgi:hypothetical protein
MEALNGVREAEVESALEHPLYDVRAATMKALLAQCSGVSQSDVGKHPHICSVWPLARTAAHSLRSLTGSRTRNTLSAQRA